MSSHFDNSVDWLADASLTPDQRRAWNAMRQDMAALKSKNQELQDRLKQAEQQSEAAEPTILNRPDFNREVARMLAFDERYGGMSSVLYFDFDHLEETAANYGRAVANAAIREIGALLIKNVRGSDIVGRLAPDEFGILLMRCDHANAWKKAEAVAVQLQNMLAEIQGCKLAIKVKYGAYTFRDNEDLAAGLQKAASSMTQTIK
jgi:diguanylate cyclase (GGDEF)-like protein